MSDEFAFSMSFNASNLLEIKEFEKLLEHLNLEETEQATNILRQRNLDQASIKIESLTSSYSSYQNGDDIVEMYTDTFNDSVDNHTVTIDEDNLLVSIEADGQDHDADDFCAALVLIAVAHGATNIVGRASSSHWCAKWENDVDNTLALEFMSEE